MKYQLETYEDFLKLSANQVRKISVDDFDLYTDEEMNNLDLFSSKFTYELNKRDFSDNALVIESSYDNFINDILTAEQLLDLPGYIVIEYFRRHPESNELYIGEK